MNMIMVQYNIKQARISNGCCYISRVCLRSSRAIEPLASLRFVFTRGINIKWLDRLEIGFGKFHRNIKVHSSGIPIGSFGYDDDDGDC